MDWFDKFDGLEEKIKEFNLLPLNEGMKMFLRETFPEPFQWSSTIVWVKDQLIMSRKDYHTQYEPLWYGWDNRGPRLVALEDRKQSDVWLIDRPKKSEEHPTMKPLELVERSITNSSLPGALVLDLFAGSGTTLIACERLGRVCRAMDNDPKYVAVCLERWSVATGQTLELEES